jgi:PilZ domain
LETSAERRASRRFTMALPLTLREPSSESSEWQGETRDVSFRGLYFLADTDFAVGSEIEFVLTLPKEITLATDVHIHCSGLVVRVEPHEGRKGVAARIERYEFLPQS